MKIKKIVIELDDYYFNKKELSYATLKYLSDKGKNCTLIDIDTINIDGEIYNIIVHNFNMMIPVQQVILKLIS